MDQRRTPDVVLKYTDFLKKSMPGIKKVFLFGSYAKGTFGEDSDMDIAIVFEKVPDIFEMQVKLMKIRRKFDTRIEPHPIREADFNPSNPFAMEVLRSGYEVQGQRGEVRDSGFERVNRA